MRDQEVVRANRELAAYFKGQRTEREARAALKIIKAFVRDRERTDAKSRRPLPGRRPGKVSGSGDAKAGSKRRKAAKRRTPRRPSAPPAVVPSEPVSTSLTDE